MSITLKENLTVKEAVAHIQSLGYGPITDQTVRVWCKKRNIGIRFGGRWLVKRKALEMLLKKGWKK